MQAVLSNTQLAEYAEYNSTGQETIDEALTSDNPYVRAVAMIIDGHENKETQKEIYNKVNQYLTQAL